MEALAPLAAICVALVVFGGLFWAGCRADRRRQARVDKIMDEIMARRRPILWVDTDGTIHSPYASAADTADYLERCAAAVREQAVDALAHDGRGAADGEG